MPTSALGALLNVPGLIHHQHRARWDSMVTALAPLSQTAGLRPHTIVG
jgi:hypothetical protein